VRGVMSPAVREMVHAATGTSHRSEIERPGAADLQRPIRAKMLGPFGDAPAAPSAYYVLRNTARQEDQKQAGNREQSDANTECTGPVRSVDG